MPSSLLGENHQATQLVADKVNHLKNGTTPEALPSTPTASEDTVDTVVAMVDTVVDTVDMVEVTADVDIAADTGASDTVQVSHTSPTHQLQWNLTAQTESLTGLPKNNSIRKHSNS